MPALPSVGAMVGDSAPTAANRAAAGSGRSGKSEKGIGVAGLEVVGRPLAVWSQKLMEWPEGFVADYRAATQEHLVRFNDPAAMDAAEKWVKLGSIRFQWLREQPENARPNPTAEGAPQAEDCLNRRLKVFWPGMGRWYQGKVQSYDAVSRKHCVKYRDGDIQELRLCHEAIIWVDAGPLPNRPAAAQQPSGKAAKTAAPAAIGAAAAAGGSRNRLPATQNVAAAPSALPSPAVNGTNTKSPTAKRPHLEEGSSGDERLKSNKSSVTQEGGLEAAPSTAPVKDHPASDQGGAAGGGGSSNIGSAYSGQSLEEEEGQAGSSSDGSGDSEEEEDDGDSSVVTDDLGSEVYSSDLDDEADSDFEVESNRNTGVRSSRRRPGASLSAPSGRPSKRRRSRVSRRANTASAGRRRRSGGSSARQDLSTKARRDYSRAASLRPSKQMRVDEEAARLAGVSVVGARVAVLWSQDQQYYKGKLVQFDSYHKRTKILYDDGEEEWISLGRETFKWLTPRGRSAGYTAEVKEALAQLGSMADGQGPDPPPGTASAGVGTRSQGGAAAPICSPTPVGEVANVAVKGSPKAESAVGWQVSVLFDGHGQWYRGEILAYDRRKGRHLVLYDDGEDEWLALEQESVAWHKLGRGANALFPGVKPGTAPPKGRAAVGWRVGVFWTVDMVFYTGEITTYDPTTGRHTIVYDDGEVRSLSLASDKVKWILPPGCVVDASKLAGMDANFDAAQAASRARKKVNGFPGESDPDYEFGCENRGRPIMRRLPRLLTTTSVAGAMSIPDSSAFLQSHQHLPAEASLAQLMQPSGQNQMHQSASPLWVGGGAKGHMHRSPAGLAIPLSPTAEQPLGETVLVRQLTRVPTLGSFSSSESETTQLPNPITVRIYMSGGGCTGGGASDGTHGTPAGDHAVTSCALSTPFAAAAAADCAAGSDSFSPRQFRAKGASQLGARQKLWDTPTKLAALDLMSRRVVRAQHTLVKGVPTHLPTHHPSSMAQQSASGGGPASSPLHHNQCLQRQQQRNNHHQQQLHRLARASTADHLMAPGHRRPHPALSDEEASSSSGSSDGESERQASPALLSPRSAAALHGAKIKPEQLQHAQQDAMDLDAVLLDAGGAVTPTDSDALGPVPPLMRPLLQQDSPFSTGGLLRSPAGVALPPLQIYTGRSLFPERAKLTGEASSAQGNSSLGQQAILNGVPAKTPGDEHAVIATTAPLVMERSSSLMGAMLDGIALQPANDTHPAGLLGIAGPSRIDSEFNLLAMGGADLPRIEDGGLMDMEVVGVGVGSSTVGELAVVDPLG